MRITVAGVGAVGGYFVGGFAHAGEDVILVTHPVWDRSKEEDHEAIR